MQLLDWHLHLDRSLPAPLDAVGTWLHEAEGALRQEFVVQHAHEATANTVHKALEQHKVCRFPPMVASHSGRCVEFRIHDNAYTCVFFLYETVFRTF